MVSMNIFGWILNFPETCPSMSLDIAKVMPWLDAKSFMTSLIGLLSAAYAHFSLAQRGVIPIALVENPQKAHKQNTRIRIVIVLLEFNWLIC